MPSYGQSNFLTNTSLLVAWEDYGQPYYNSKGHISIPRDDVLLARLVMWDNFFMPGPWDNQYIKNICQLNEKIINLEIETKKGKKDRYKAFGLGMAVGGGTVLLLSVGTILAVISRR